MHRVEPEVHLIASTEVDHEALGGYLTSIGALGWESDAVSDVEEIIEVMSRSCYKSYEPGLNPNVTRTRKENRDHLANILKSGHGSVLEHGWVSFMFTDVSRVFTHELVRHRQGTAISQESLRFVRLEDLGLWIPSCYADDPEAVDIFTEAFTHAEAMYAGLLEAAAAKEGVADFNELPFSKKKEYTSAARRVAPIGLATNIGWSCNIRALRHVIEMRTASAAEEEIRLAFAKVAEIAISKWPSIFSDYKVTEVNGIKAYHSEYRKV